MISVGKILEIADSRGMDIQWASEYAEPGYGASENGIVFADWNDRTRYNPETRERTVVDYTPSRIERILEHCGCEIEWSDEWALCGDCYKAVRVSADCYHWLPSYKIFNDCELFCRECILDDIDSYIEELIDNPDTADTFDVDWSEHGFTLMDETYETGFHPGQNDDPHKVAEICGARA